MKLIVFTALLSILISFAAQKPKNDRNVKDFYRLSTIFDKAVGC
jgi:hypothetical protein